MEISQGGETKGMLLSLKEGARTVIRNPLMRIIVVQNIAMGCFFMGAFIVCFPLVIRGLRRLVFRPGVDECL